MPENKFIVDGNRISIDLFAICGSAFPSTLVANVSLILIERSKLQLRDGGPINRADDLIQPREADTGHTQ